jgi:hypothetical protein
MRIPPTCLLAVLLVFGAPASGRADVISFEVTDAGELSVSFGLLPFQLSSNVESRNFLLDGSVQLVSGSLLERVVDVDNGVTSYHYGRGMLQLELSGSTDDGAFVQGGFTATTSPFRIDVFEDADTLFGGGLADDFYIDIGVGRFDLDIAQLLDVRRRTLGGELLLGLEAIDGGPDSNRRNGYDHRGFADLELDVTAVPEPGGLALGLLAALCWAARRTMPRRRDTRDLDYL